MTPYEKLDVCKELIAWAKRETGEHVRYLEERIYAVPNKGMVILVEASSPKEALRKARRMNTVVNQYGTGAQTIAHVETLNIQ